MTAVATSSDVRYCFVTDGLDEFEGSVDQQQKLVDLIKRISDFENAKVVDFHMLHRLVLRIRADISFRLLCRVDRNPCWREPFPPTLNFDWRISITMILPRSFVIDFERSLE